MLRRNGKGKQAYTPSQEQFASFQKFVALQENPVTQQAPHAHLVTFRRGLGTRTGGQVVGTALMASPASGDPKASEVN